MARVIDISQRLRASLPVWPGDTDFRLERTWKLDESCPVNVSRLTLSTHSGTHADAPLHYAKSGEDAASVVLEPYIGLCQVLDARDHEGFIEPRHLSQLETGVERVLFRTYRQFPHDTWQSDFCAIKPEVIDVLAAKGVLLIGLDSPSLDPETSKTLDAHKRVLAHDMRVLEGLVLDAVTSGTYELIALPLSVEGADASPVRAILRTLP